MESSAMAMTAKVAAAGRAKESLRPDRLFADPLAAVLAGPEGFAWMEEWRLPGMPEENPMIGPRTRFFDDLVVRAVQEGSRQVVLVGAGMDTRACRLGLPREVTIFELDKDEVLASKQDALDGVGAVPTCRRVTVPVELEGGRWPQALRGAGFEGKSTTTFVAEGLSCYLSENDNALLLDNMARLAAPGSRLGIDMLSRAYLENSAVVPFLELLKAKGLSWQFGTDEPAAFLAARGWSAEVNDFDSVGRHFGRWPPPGVPEEAAARAATASRSFFISAERYARS